MFNFRLRIRGLTECRATPLGWVAQHNGRLVRIEYRLPWRKCWPTRIVEHRGLLLQSRRGRVYLANELQIDSKNTHPNSRKALRKIVPIIFLITIFILTLLWPKANESSSTETGRKSTARSNICESTTQRDKIAEMLWHDSIQTDAAIVAKGEIVIGGMRAERFQFKCGSITEEITISSLQKNGEWVFAKISRSIANGD